MLLETASVLKDINRGDSEWKEYHALKSKTVCLGRDILSNYDSHRLYLDQQGITKEKLEIGVGLKHRPLSNVELNAKNTVALYAKASRETREMFNAMKKEVFTISQHAYYGKYCEMRGARNDLAKEILSNKALHRKFIREASRGSFVSFRAMENQVNYGNAIKEEHIKTQEISQSRDPQQISNLGQLAELIKNTAIKHKRIPDTFEKLRIPLNEIYIKHQESSLYKIALDAHRERRGYGLYVNSSMLKAYLHSKGIELPDHRQMSEYASMLVQQEVDSQKLKEVSIDLLNCCIKRSVCLIALKNANGSEFSAQRVNELHYKSAILSKEIKNEDMHLLGNKEFMEKANNIIIAEKSTNGLSTKNVEQLMSLNVRSIHNANEREMIQSKEHIKQHSKDLEISM
jgi:hypothetical protein